MSAFRDNAAQHRYELEEAEGISFANYKDVAGVRAIMHVETPAPAEGRGYATKLMNEIVAHARAAGLKLRASCPFAVAYFRRHGEATDVEVD
jgi:predicted GNAT family acetyltransferase